MVEVVVNQEQEEARPSSIRRLVVGEMMVSAGTKFKDVQGRVVFKVETVDAANGVVDFADVRPVLEKLGDHVDAALIRCGADIEVPVEVARHTYARIEQGSDQLAQCYTQ